MSVCPVFTTGISSGLEIQEKDGQNQSPTEPELSLNCDQMEHLEGERYSQYPVERNPRAYMSMRDYRNPPWVSAPSYMVPPQYAPPPHPQSTSLMEEVILNLTKLVGNFVEAPKTINAQLSQKIDTMENNVNKRIDGLQSEMEHKFDNLQCSISKLAQQHDHQEEESQEEECLSHTMVEEHQKLILQPIPIDLDPSVTAQPKSNPLLEYILPTAQPAPGAPTGKATPIALPALQNFEKLVVIVQAFATTSKTMAATHTA